MASIVKQAINQNRRRIIFPIDGAPTFGVLLNQAEAFFADTDVCEWVGMIKLNDGLHIPLVGSAIVPMVRKVIPDSVGFFLDLKIFDVSATMINILRWYAEYGISIVTVCSKVSVKGLIAIRETMPNTKIAMVDTLTDMSPEECLRRFGMTPAGAIAEAVKGLEGELGDRNPIDLIVCGANDLGYLRTQFGDTYGFVCPGIRDAWMRDGGNKDHQERVSGIYDALKSGATYAVMGSQLTNGNPKADISAEESRQLTWKEIARYFEGVEQ